MHVINHISLYRLLGVFFQTVFGSRQRQTEFASRIYIRKVFESDATADWYQQSV